MNDNSPSAPIESIRWEDRTCIVSVAGDINIECVVEFQRRLLTLTEKKPQKIVIDLGGVEFMDSSGVASLVKLLSTTKKSGIELRLASLDERVRGVFEITRLDTVFDIRNSVEEAIA